MLSSYDMYLIEPMSNYSQVIYTYEKFANIKRHSQDVYC